jgi:O-methyltransferase
VKRFVKSVLRRFPTPLRLGYHRLRWFIRNYRQIRSNSELFNAVHGMSTYNTDGLCTSNNADFQNTPRFAKAYAAAASTMPWEGFTLQWRVHVVCVLADMVRQLPGDFVECGVNTGAYARAILDYIDFQQSGKQFWLFDTYEGLVPALVSQRELDAGIGDYFKTYSNVYQQVLNTFREFPCKIVKGAVPDTLVQFTGDQVAYLSIDMNCVAPEMAALEYFWDKIVPGGVIVLDDYGFPAHIHQKHAFDDFAARKQTPLLCLPTGQAVMFKH